MDASGSVNRDVTTVPATPGDLLTAVIEMSDDAIFTCDWEGSVVTWSATAERLFGCPAHQVLDQPLEVLFPIHLADEVRSVISIVLAGERIKHFETEVVRPDGMPLPVSLSLCPVLDQQKTPVGSVVIARDVTEQHLAQAALAEIDARLEEGEALAHIGSWMWDVRTGVVQWSTEFYRLHGFDPQDFDGTFESYLALIHPDDREAVREAMVSSVESGRPYQAEYRVTRADGSVHHLRVRAQPSFGSDGGGVGLRGIGLDITAQKVSPNPPGS
jgi:PAS domain S-box-containing protein